MLETRSHPAPITHRLVVTPVAERRLAETCRDILDDALSFGALDLPQAPDRELIRDAVTAAAAHATRVAMEILAEDVADSLSGAPDRLLQRIAESRRMERVRPE
jgi:hypothetical protein